MPRAAGLTPAARGVHGLSVFKPSRTAYQIRLTNASSSALNRTFCALWSRARGVEAVAGGVSVACVIGSIGRGREPPEEESSVLVSVEEPWFRMGADWEPLGGTTMERIVAPAPNS